VPLARNQLSNSSRPIAGQSQRPIADTEANRRRGQSQTPTKCSLNRSLHPSKCGRLRPAVDSSTGTVHVRRRDYQAIVARWMSQDPLGIGPDNNPYRYVRANPVNVGDPSGLTEFIVRCPPEALQIAVGDCAALGGVNWAKPPICIIDYFIGRVFGQYVKAFCNHTGNCWATQYVDLRGRVRGFCDLPRSCSLIECCPPGTTFCRPDCDDINRRLFNNDSCISARRAIMNQCFDGGDNAHRAELQRVLNTRAVCLAKKKECGC